MTGHWSGDSKATVIQGQRGPRLLAGWVGRWKDPRRDLAGRLLPSSTALMWADGGRASRGPAEAQGLGRRGRAKQEREGLGRGHRCGARGPKGSPVVGKAAPGPLGRLRGRSRGLCGREGPPPSRRDGKGAGVGQTHQAAESQGHLCPSTGAPYTAGSFGRLVLHLGGSECEEGLSYNQSLDS